MPRQKRKSLKVISEMQKTGARAKHFRAGGVSRAKALLRKLEAATLNQEE